MTFINAFAKQVERFFQENWWVTIIYIGMLVLIYIYRAGDFIPVSLVSSLHFIGDILIMMMFTAYDEKNYKSAGYLQVLSLLIFLSVKVYTGVAQKGWYYILADPIYILAAIKSYYLPVKGIDLKFINFASMTVLSAILLISFRIFGAEQVPIAPQQWIQTLGIHIFAIALCTTPESKLQYVLSVMGLTAMIVGSAFDVMYAWREGNLKGLSISYMLLPLTVLIYRLKNVRQSFVKAT